MPTKRNKEIARRLQEQEPVGIPAAEGEEYVEPGKEYVSDDAAATHRVESTMAKKYARDEYKRKMASGHTEPSFLQAEDLPLGLAKGLAKVGAIVGADMLKKAIPLMMKRYALKDAYDAAEGAAKKAAYNIYFDVHKEVEDLIIDMSKSAGKSTKEAEFQVRGEISRELEGVLQDKYMPTLERIFKGKYKIMDDFPSTPDEIQHALRTKVNNIDEAREVAKRLAANKRAVARRKVARQKAKNEAADMPATEPPVPMDPKKPEKIITAPPVKAEKRPKMSRSDRLEALKSGRDDIAEQYPSAERVREIKLDAAADKSNIAVRKKQAVSKKVKAKARAAAKARTKRAAERDNK